jgi:hypothetical protein
MGAYEAPSSTLDVVWELVEKLRFEASGVKTLKRPKYLRRG